MALQGRRGNSGAEPARVPARKVQTQLQFRKCENSTCGQTLFVKEIEKNLHCCKHCGHHFRVGSRRRVEITLDPGTWRD